MKKGTLMARTYPVPTLSKCPRDFKGMTLNVFQFSLEAMKELAGAGHLELFARLDDADSTGTA